MEHSLIGAGNTNLYSQYGNQYGNSSDNWESIYLKTQLYHCGSLDIYGTIISYGVEVMGGVAILELGWSC